MPPADAPVPVFIYFDYICPYSYLAQSLLDTVHVQQPLAIVWRPLDLGRAGEDVDELGEAGWDELAERAATLRVPLYRPTAVPATGLAHQAAQFARDLGAEAHRRLHQAIFRGHFVRRIDVGRRHNLVALANEEGIDRQALERALDDGRYLEELAAAEEEAKRYEISQTPTIFFGRFKVVGAASLEVMRDAARRAAAEM